MHALTPNVSNKSESGRPVKWLAGKLFRSTGLAGLALAAVFALGQAAITTKQWLAERDAEPMLAAMRAEQTWLMEQGLAPRRRITAFEDGSPGVRSDWTLDGWKTSVGFEKVDEWARAWGLGILKRDPVIYGSSEFSQFTDLMSPQVVYRHEEGHARQTQRSLGSPEGLPREIAKLLSARMAAVKPAAREIGRGQFLDWRDRWLLEAHSEAFADAFAVLSKARAGEDAYREAALSLHAARVFGDMRPKDGGASATSALEVLGDGHAVDMASFLAGQFDSQQVARLDSAGLDDLASQVADASLAWAVARQGGPAGFFAPAGHAWWMNKVALFAPESSQKLWAQLKNASMGKSPQGAFGAREFMVGQEIFKAKGLPATPSMFGAQWRFDGFGGTMGWAPGVEPGVGGPMDLGMMVAAIGPTDEASDQRHNNAARSAGARRKMGIHGAMWTHWALSRRMGADMGAEAARVQKHMGYHASPGQAQTLFDSWSRLAHEMDGPKARAKVKP